MMNAVQSGILWWLWAVLWFTAGYVLCALLSQTREPPQEWYDHRLPDLEEQEGPAPPTRKEPR
jgi:hypothetical protein